MKNDSLECFLTYADNNAVGYFAKQGFTKEITFSGDRVCGSLNLCATSAAAPARWLQSIRSIGTRVLFRVLDRLRPSAFSVRVTLRQSPFAVHQMRERSVDSGLFHQYCCLHH